MAIAREALSKITTAAQVPCTRSAAASQIILAGPRVARSGIQPAVPQEGRSGHHVHLWIAHQAGRDAVPEGMRRHPLDLGQAGVLLHRVPERVGCERLAGPAAEEGLSRMDSPGCGIGKLLLLQVGVEYPARPQVDRHPSPLAPFTKPHRDPAAALAQRQVAQRQAGGLGRAQTSRGQQLQQSVIAQVAALPGLAAHT